MVRSGRQLERGTRTAPFPANVRASCGARFPCCFPQDRAAACIFIEEELPDNRRVVRSSFEGSVMLIIISWRRSLGLVLQVFCEARDDRAEVR
jgi:hypothetical protein